MQLEYNDLPYLEPLLMWLRNDETLKEVFTDKSFFMPKLDLAKATTEALQKECPAPRALWIFPLDTDAISQKEGCRNQGSHSFGIIIYVQCIRQPFELIKKESKVILGGEFMELIHIRALVKDSLRRFAIKNSKDINKKFEKVVWTRDRNLYPESDAFLGTSIEYKVNIL